MQFTHLADVYNKLGAYIAVELMKQYLADWIIEKYWQSYENICEEYKLIPTKTVTPVSGDNLQQEYKEKFTRGNYVRLCNAKNLLHKLEEPRLHIPWTDRFIGMNMYDCEQAVKNNPIIFIMC